MPSCAEEQLGINEADKAMAVGAKPLAGSAMATLPLAMALTATWRPSWPVLSFIRMRHILQISALHHYIQCICILATNHSTVVQNLRNLQLTILPIFQRYDLISVSILHQSHKYKS